MGTPVLIGPAVGAGVSCTVGLGVGPPGPPVGLNVVGSLLGATEVGKSVVGGLVGAIGGVVVSVGGCVTGANVGFLVGKRKPIGGPLTGDNGVPAVGSGVSGADDGILKLVADLSSMS